MASCVLLEKMVACLGHGRGFPSNVRIRGHPVIYRIITDRCDPPMAAAYIIIYGNLQAMTTKLYKNADGSAGQPTGYSAFMWAGYCSVVPLVTGM